MAGRGALPLPLRAVLLLCAALPLALADVVVYENDLNLENIPGVEGHSWTVMDDSKETPTQFVMEIQSMSGTGENSLSAVNSMMGRSDSILGTNTSGMGWSFGLENGNDVLDWFNQQLSTFGGMGNTIWVDPMGRPQFFGNSTMFGSRGCEDVRTQMLQQVARERLRSALLDAGLNDWDTLEGDNEFGQFDDGYDFLVTFDPNVVQDQQLDNAYSNFEVYSSDDSSDESSESSDWAPKSSESDSNVFPGDHNYNIWGKVLFVTLIVGCSLTLVLIVKQGLELCRTMSKASTKICCGRGKHCGDNDIRRPLLSSLAPETFEKTADNYPVVVVAACSPRSNSDL